MTVHGTEELAQAARADHDDYRAILVQAIGDRLVEAAAEYVHRLVRTDAWGYAPDEALAPDDLIRETYAGIRPAPGYPSQPDHTEKLTLFEVLDAETATGVALTESPRDVAAVVASAASSSGTRTPTTSTSASSGATRSKTTPRARACLSKRSSSGSRPRSATTPATSRPAGRRRRRRGAAGGRRLALGADVCWLAGVHPRSDRAMWTRWLDPSRPAADPSCLRPAPDADAPVALTSLLALAALIMLSLAVATHPGGVTPPRAHGGGTVQAEPARARYDDRPRRFRTSLPVPAQRPSSASMAQAAPQTDDETFFGLTTTALSFRYRREQQAGRCTLTDVRVDLAVSVELPRWTRPPGAPYDLARDWARFESALRRHEDVHRVLAEDGAEATRVALDRLAAPTCAEADLSARAIADRINIETEATHRRYDDETGHGATQGASWPLRR